MTLFFSIFLTVLGGLVWVVAFIALVILTAEEFSDDRPLRGFALVIVILLWASLGATLIVTHIDNHLHAPSSCGASVIQETP